MVAKIVIKSVNNFKGSSFELPLFFTFFKTDAQWKVCTSFLKKVDSNGKVVNK